VLSVVSHVGEEGPVAVGTRRHVLLHFGKWLGTGAQKGHPLKRVTHQRNTSWSSLAFDEVDAGGASYISHGWT